MGKGTSIVLALGLGVVAGVGLGWGGLFGLPAQPELVSASAPDVVVRPPAPPAGPIPIPYPNLLTRSGGESRVLVAFRLAELRSGGVIEVQDVVIE